jgi:hypothetical protein
MLSAIPSHSFEVIAASVEETSAALGGMLLEAAGARRRKRWWLLQTEKQVHHTLRVLMRNHPSKSVAMLAAITPPTMLPAAFYWTTSLCTSTPGLHTSLGPTSSDTGGTFGTSLMHVSRRPA